MQLKPYLRSTMLRDESMLERQQRFAKGVGVTIHAVRKWLNKERGINDFYKLRIVQVTGGAVRLEDLVEWSASGVR